VYTLRGRITKGEQKYLENYLSPVITDEDKKKFEDRRALQKSMLETAGLLEESEKYQSDYGDGMNDDDNMDEKLPSESADSDFQNEIVNYSDMD
jgi:hypothetical protein